MPLLMVDPAPGPLPPEVDMPILGGEALSVDVRQGQLLTVGAPDGGQVAALFAWTASDPGEWLSPHHTRVFGGTFELRMGTRLATNRRRPIFVVGRDSLRRHDLLLPASDAAVEAVCRALGRAKIEVPRIPDPVNVFAWARLDHEGRIDVRPSPARPGERWTVRVLIDAHVAVAAAPMGVPEGSVDPSRPLHVTVRNDVRELLPDLPVWRYEGHTEASADPHGQRL